MVRIVGLNKNRIDFIANNYHEICRYLDKDHGIVEFMSGIKFEYFLDHVEFSYGDNFISLLHCDYWRIEIE